MNDLKLCIYEQEKVKTEVQVSERGNARGDEQGLQNGWPVDYG